MPITPFHFGPGALIKAMAPQHVSWTAFALANGLIDLEPILLPDLHSTTCFPEEFLPKIL